MNAHLLQAVQLTWSADLRVTRAEGDCEGVLHHTAAELQEQPLHEVLGVSAEQAQALDRRAREGGHTVEFLYAQLGEGAPTPLRLVLGLEQGEAAAGVVDLRAMLEGAPPVQLSRLSSSLSHEMRNPLSSVKMAVQTLARHAGLSDRDKRRLTIANREIRTLERMLWLLSEYGREEGSPLELHAPWSLVQEAAALVAPELEERRLSVQVVQPPQVPRVRADAPRLRHVLSQVLLNSTLGYPEGSSVEVLIRPEPEARQVHVVLRDPATSLPPEELGSVFEPFCGRLARGAGLSLATLRRIMLRQGGNISVEAGAEQGVVLTLTFVM
jgi:two-component system, NtrC family, sensor histidine kinase HydH